MVRAKKIVGTKTRGVKESDIVFSPCSKPQERFLSLDGAASLTIYGGEFCASIQHLLNR